MTLALQEYPLNKYKLQTLKKETRDVLTFTLKYSNTFIHQVWKAGTAACNYCERSSASSSTHHTAECPCVYFPLSTGITNPAFNDQTVNPVSGHQAKVQPQ